MILAVLQARVSSSRLPGKVIKPILGRPMLSLQLERLSRMKKVDKLMVATSSDPSDDPLAILCSEENVACFRGSLDDVLDRFYHAALPYLPDSVVRLTGDCPLADPAVIDQLVDFFISSGYDYVSNCLEPSWPDGLDAEVFRFSCLQQAWREASLPSEREHVTPFIYRQPERFRIGSLKNHVDLSGLRWTVDEAADFELVTAVYKDLYPGNPAFATGDILALLDRNPALREMNIRHPRNAGYVESLLKDKGSP